MDRYEMDGLAQGIVQGFKMYESRRAQRVGEEERAGEREYRATRDRQSDMRDVRDFDATQAFRTQQQDNADRTFETQQSQWKEGKAARDAALAASKAATADIAEARKDSRARLALDARRATAEERRLAARERQTNLAEQSAEQQREADEIKRQLAAWRATLESGGQFIADDALFEEGHMVLQAVNPEKYGHPATPPPKGAVLRVANTLFRPRLDANKGTTIDKPTPMMASHGVKPGAVRVRQEITEIPINQKGDVTFTTRMIVQNPDGSQAAYPAVITENRSADPDDKIKIVPGSAVIQQLEQRLAIAAQLKKHGVTPANFGGLMEAIDKYSVGAGYVNQTEASALGLRPEKTLSATDKTNLMAQARAYVSENPGTSVTAVYEAMRRQVEGQAMEGPGLVSGGSTDVMPGGVTAPAQKSKQYEGFSATLVSP